MFLYYHHQYEAVTEEMISHELGKGHAVEEILGDDRRRILFFRAGGRSIRVFCSDHRGGIMEEDGVAIPQTVFYGPKGMNQEPKPFVRVVGIKEGKFLDFAFSELSWKPRDETQTMNANLSMDQRSRLLREGEPYGGRQLTPGEEHAGDTEFRGVGRSRFPSRTAARDPEYANLVKVLNELRSKQKITAEERRTIESRYRNEPERRKEITERLEALRQ